MSNITPPPELLQQWAFEWMQLQNVNRDNFMATRAAQWGADQELELCCEWLTVNDYDFIPLDLHAARRPKPPSLKQQAIAELEQIPIDPEAGVLTSSLETIRRALEALPDE